MQAKVDTPFRINEVLEKTSRKKVQNYSFQPTEGAWPKWAGISPPAFRINSSARGAEDSPNPSDAGPPPPFAYVPTKEYKRILPAVKLIPLKPTEEK